jgi:hypothetical protein
MSKKQNPSVDEDESSLHRDEESTREKSEPPRSYYYDDATGYEIYEGETDTDEDVEDPDEEAR